jgi:hypothetical protein
MILFLYKDFQKSIFKEYLQLQIKNKFNKMAAKFFYLTGTKIRLFRIEKKGII